MALKASMDSTDQAFRKRFPTRSWRDSGLHPERQQDLRKAHGHASSGTSMHARSKRGSATGAPNNPCGTTCAWN